MNTEKWGMKQRAVLWPFTGYDYNGDPIVSSPIEIKVRWETGLAESIDANAAPIAATASVVVDRKIAAGSVLRLGRFVELPAEPDNLQEVVNYETAPSQDNQETLHFVTLRKYSNKLPQVV